MAEGNSPGREPHSQTVRPDEFAIPALAGTFAFRFTGHTVKASRPYYLLGIGQLTLDRVGKIIGRQQSAIVEAQGQGATVMSGEYALSGNMNVASSGAGVALVTYTSTDGKGLDVLGEFYVQVGGDVDHIWMISAKAFDLNIQGKEGKKSIVEAIELASIDAVRMALPGA